MRKWNFATKKYEDYQVPADWKVSLYETDMSTIVNCASCGIELEFGDCYTSRKIHTEMGMGYGVCSDCYEIEFQDEKVTMEGAE